MSAGPMYFNKELANNNKNRIDIVLYNSGTDEQLYTNITISYNGLPFDRLHENDRAYGLANGFTNKAKIVLNDENFIYTSLNPIYTDSYGIRVDSNDYSGLLACYEKKESFVEDNTNRIIPIIKVISSFSLSSEVDSEVVVHWDMSKDMYRLYSDPNETKSYNIVVRNEDGELVETDELEILKFDLLSSYENATQHKMGR